VCVRITSPGADGRAGRVDGLDFERQRFLAMRRGRMASGWAYVPTMSMRISLSILGPALIRSAIPIALSAKPTRAKHFIRSNKRFSFSGSWLTSFFSMARGFEGRERGLFILFAVGNSSQTVEDDRQGWTGRLAGCASCAPLSYTVPSQGRRTRR
jgi:hypothetical protein